MDGVVGQGTLLAGRYRLLRPIRSDLVGATAWDANDQILDRAVRVSLLVQGHVPQAVDAARRAALVADPRFVRVLDVGTHEGHAYMITEPVVGPSLAQLVAHGPLPADQARALIGEAAEALEAARRRGVHHLTLRPSALHLAADDRVLITGLAIDGALLGQGIDDAPSTTRADTVGLVSLLYAALTGRWPGEAFGAQDTAGAATQLPPAPLVEGRPVAPTELVAGIPNDLDTLCAVTLGPNDDGPHSPAELILELEPWGSIRGIDLLAAAKEPLSDPTTAATRGALAGPDGSGLRATSEATRPAVDAPPASPATVQRQSVRSAFAAQPPGTAARPATPPAAAPARTTEFGPMSGLSTGSAAITTALPATSPAPASPPAGSNDSRALPTPPTGQNLSSPPADDNPPSASDDHLSARDSFTTRRFDPTRLVLAVVSIAVLIGLFLAFRALTAPIGDAPPRSAPLPTVSAPAEETPAPEAEETPAPEAPVVAPAIVSGQSLDPPPGGDNNEHPEAAPLAVDGDPATAWYTRTFNGPDFSGLKPGVGYAVSFEAPATVTTVTLQVDGTGGQVEVRATDPSTPTEGPVLASDTLGGTTVLTLSAPTETQHIVLWFTALPQTADGSNRLELAEVSVS